ncbi:MAG: hypothetical protein ABFC38_08240 [Methanospirillum sp.]
MRWKFVDLRGGGDIQIVTTESERDRFVRYCSREQIRCGLLRVEETGIVVELPVLEEWMAILFRSLSVRTGAVSCVL